MGVDDVGLAEFLLSSGALSRHSFDEALQAYNGEGSFGTTLVARGYITDDDFRRAVAGVLGLPFTALKRDDIDPTALLLIPEPIARAYTMLGFRLHDNELEVALLHPDDAQILETLELPYSVRLHITTDASIKQGLLHYQKLLKERFSKTLENSGHAVEAFLHHALLSRAHGVHVDLSTAGAIVRYRLGSALHEAMRLPSHIGQALVERLKQLAKLMPISRTLQEGRFKFEQDGERHAVHVSVLPTLQGERLVLRIMQEHEGRSGFALSSLGFRTDALEQVYSLLHERSGLVLIAGLEGGGKTTMAYTLLDQLPTHALSVATVEEKIDYMLPHVAHTLNKPQFGVGSGAALRSVLRTNPNVVLVDPIADPETAFLALQTANMGTRVIGIIQASSAIKAIEQLRTWAIQPDLLAATLRGVIGVDVVGRLCSRDREEYRLSRAESAPLEPFADFGRVLKVLKEEGTIEQDKQWKELLFPRAAPCAHCEQGYVALAGVQEVLLISQTLKDLVRRNAPLEDIEKKAKEEGMLTITEDALIKTAQGVTGIEEVFRLAGTRQ